MVNKERIIKLKEMKERSRDRQEYNYQCTGDKKYLSLAKAYDEYADICNIALKSVDDHNIALTARSQISSLANQASSAIYHNNIDQMKKTLHDLMRVANNYGWKNRYE